MYEDRFLYEDDLKRIVDNYYSLFEERKWLLDIDDFESYKIEVYDHYKRLFVNQTDIYKHIATIIEKASYTWDMYRVSLNDLNILNLFESEISLTKFRLDEFRTILQSCLHYDYSKRPKQEKILKTISSFSLI